jgi:hypothetical protein
VTENVARPTQEIRGDRIVWSYRANVFNVQGAESVLMLSSWLIVYTSRSLRAGECPAATDRGRSG